MPAMFVGLALLTSESLLFTIIIGLLALGFSTFLFVAGKQLDKASETVVLYKPVDMVEFDLIKKSGFRRFPPRLPHHPGFTAVVHSEFAKEIAGDLINSKLTKNPASVVLVFEVYKMFLDKYEKKTFGSKQTEEVLVPSNDLEQLNDNISGKIKVIDILVRQT